MKAAAGPAKLKNNQVLPCRGRSASIRNFTEVLALYFENKSSPSAAGGRGNKLKPKQFHSFHYNSHFSDTIPSPWVAGKQVSSVMRLRKGR